MYYNNNNYTISQCHHHISFETHLILFNPLMLSDQPPVTWLDRISIGWLGSQAFNSGCVSTMSRTPIYHILEPPIYYIQDTWLYILEPLLPYLLLWNPELPIHYSFLSLDLRSYLCYHWLYLLSIFHLIIPYAFEPVPYAQLFISFDFLLCFLIWLSFHLL